MGLIYPFGDKVITRPSQQQFYNSSNPEKNIPYSIRNQIFRNNTNNTTVAGGVDSTIYTVPTGKAFFISGYTICLGSIVTTGAFPTVSLVNSTNSDSIGILRGRFAVTENINMAISHSFQTPIKIDGDSILVNRVVTQTGVNTVGTIHIYGWEEPEVI